MVQVTIPEPEKDRAKTMRNAAKAIGGYYPTPERVSHLLSRCLTSASGKGELRTFDPCCGTGAALVNLTANLTPSPITVGVELNAERSRLAQDLLTRALHADIFKVRCTHSSFSLMLLNPPYDEDASGGRQELSFLKHTLPYLVTGGILIYIIPLVRLLDPKICSLLTSWFKDLRVFRFPNPEFQDFKQAVVLGYKKDRGERSEAAAKDFARTALSAPPLAESDLPSYVVPRVEGKWEIASLEIDPQEAQETVRQRSPLWETPEALRYFRDTTSRTCQPLLPPRKAHVATLAAAGLLNNAVIEGPKGKKVLKGSVRKVFVKDKEKSTDNKTVEREQLIITVKVIDEAGDITAIS
jgi:hypothetical protein